MFKLPKNMKKYGLKDFLGFNSGLMIHGDQGTGKSGLLMLCAEFAYENNWIVVQVPKCTDLTQNEAIIERENFSGLYTQHDQSVQFLENFKKSNPQISNIPVNMDLYGFYSHGGQHQNETEAAPNIYNEERKVYFKEFETHYVPQEQEYMDEVDRRTKLLTMKIRLPQPNNLMDLVDKGIQEKNLATCAVYELMEQLYNLESHCVMILIDEYNYLFRNSTYRSFRYANTNNSFIPPYHLSLCRAFLKFDGHLIKNGVKICASSIKALHKHEFGPKQIMLPEKGYNLRMDGLKLDDFRNLLEYLFQNNLWHANDYDADFHQQLWMETQGNIGQALKTINFNLREFGW